MKTFKQFLEDKDPAEEEWSGSRYGRTKDRLEKVGKLPPARSKGKRSLRSPTQADAQYHGQPKAAKKK